VPRLMILVSAVLVLSCGQIHTQNYKVTDANEHLTPTTVVGVRNYILFTNIRVRYCSGFCLRI